MLYMTCVWTGWGLCEVLFSFKRSHFFSSLPLGICCVWIQYIRHIYSDVHLLVCYCILRMMKSEMMNEVITSTIDSITEFLNKICFGKVFINDRSFNLPPNNF